MLVLWPNTTPQPHCRAPPQPPHHPHPHPPPRHMPSLPPAPRIPLLPRLEEKKATPCHAIPHGTHNLPPHLPGEHPRYETSIAAAHALLFPAPSTTGPEGKEIEESRTWWDGWDVGLGLEPVNWGHGFISHLTSHIFQYLVGGIDKRPTFLLLYSYF